MIGDHVGVVASVGCDLVQRSGEGALHDLNAGALIPIQLGGEAVQVGGELNQGAATAGHDPLFHRGAGGVQGIFDAQFAVAQFRFGGGADFDHRNATGQLGDALGELLAVVLRLGVLQLALDRRHPVAHGGLVGVTGHDRGVVLADRDPAHTAEILQTHLIQRHGAVFADQVRAGQDGDVLELGLAAIAKARGADGGHLEDAAVLVDHQGGQGLTFDFLREDHQRLAGFRDGLEDGDQVVDRADLAVGDQEQCIVEFANATVVVGHEIGGAVAPIEGHAFGDLQFGRQALALLNGDDAIDAHLVHGLADHPAHFLVTTGADGGHLADGVTRNGGGALLDARHDLSSGFFHAAAQAHWAGASRHVAQTFAGHRLGEDRGGRRSVTGLVLGFGGDLQEQFGAQILEGVFEFDVPGDGHAVVDHIGGAELFLEHHVAALGTDGDLHRIGEGVHAALEIGAGFIGEGEQLGHRGG